MQLTHTRHSSPASWTLDDYRDQIVREIDGVALRVGGLLREAKRRDPDNFGSWVENDLPFGAETAKRLMAISAAYEKLPVEQLRQLPRPWQAMYALKALPKSVLQEGMASGEIHPNMTVRQARAYASGRKDGNWKSDRTSRADLVAGRLMQFGAVELSPAVRSVLEGWLSRAS